MNDIKVSIVVPVYNTEAYLEKTIDDLRGQTLQEIEIIIVDDGSNAECFALCDAVGQKDSRIRVIHQKNKGVSTARNVGIEVAKGKYIGFVDSDDSVKADMYQVLYSNAEKINADISCVSEEIVMEDGRIKVASESEQIRIWKTTEEALRDFLEYKYISMSVYTKIYKAEICKKISFDTQIKINEDKLFVFRALLLSSNVCFQPVNKYIYFRRLNSSSIGKFSSKYFDLIKVGNIIESETAQIYPQLLNEAKVNLISAYLRTLKLMVQRNGQNEYKNEFNDIIKKLRKYPIKFCFTRLYHGDIVRWIIIRANKMMFMIFTRYLDKD
jgi:glycosyltransferase involved in cell wall biosynthesis